jgi:deazaflavin-dependent oxidoreductase (nitroreductase family)
MEVQFDWRRMKNIQKIHRALYAIGLGALIGRMVLLLTTTGRKTGQKRITALQYEDIKGRYFIGSARGLHADWVRNLQADPQVDVRVKNIHFHGTAEVVTDAVRFADFLEVRLQRHPRLMGLLMARVHHLPKHPSRAQMEELSKNEALVIVSPNVFSEN